MTDKTWPDTRYYLDCIKNIYLPKIDHNFLMAHTTFVRDLSICGHPKDRTTAPILLDKPVYVPIFLLGQVPRDRRNLGRYLLHVEKIYIDHGEGYIEYQIGTESWLPGGGVRVKAMGLGYITLLLKNGILSVSEVPFEYKSIAPLIYFEYEHWRYVPCPI